MPRLTLRGTAPPVLAGDRIIAGFDNGKVLAIDPRNGDVLWDAIVNAPRGRTELERLADIDSPAHVSGDDIFVVGFQGRVAMLALDSGQIWWARDASSYRGFAMDDENLYLTNSDSVVMAMRRSDGAVQWEQDALQAPRSDGAGDRRRCAGGRRLRGLSALARQGDRRDRRAPEDRRRAHHQSPVTSDAGVFVQTDSGKLLAFQSQANEAQAERERLTESREQPARRLLISAHRRRLHQSLTSHMLPVIALVGRPTSASRRCSMF